jgi:hypothetical protein
MSASPHNRLIDTPLYQRYGAIADGKVPYRDFEVSTRPARAGLRAGACSPADREVSTGFRRSFETLMFVRAAALSPWRWSAHSAGAP